MKRCSPLYLSTVGMHFPSSAMSLHLADSWAENHQLCTGETCTHPFRCKSISENQEHWQGGVLILSTTLLLYEPHKHPSSDRYFFCVYTRKTKGSWRTALATAIARKSKSPKFHASLLLSSLWHHTHIRLPLTVINIPLIFFLLQFFLVLLSSDTGRVAECLNKTLQIITYKKFKAPWRSLDANNVY